MVNNVSGSNWNTSVAIVRVVLYYKKCFSILKGKRDHCTTVFSYLSICLIEG